MRRILLLVYIVTNFINQRQKPLSMLKSDQSARICLLMVSAFGSVWIFGRRGTACLGYLTPHKSVSECGLWPENGIYCVILTNKTTSKKLKFSTKLEKAVKHFTHFLNNLTRRFFEHKKLFVPKWIKIQHIVCIFLKLNKIDHNI